MKQKFKKHAINVFGRKLDQKVVVFESDDWGSIRIPNNRVKEQLLEIKAIRENDPFSMYDCLESADDLLALYDVLGDYRDENGRNPSITANMVMTNPDFEAIKNNRFTKYESELFLKTYNSYYPECDTFATLVNGIKEKLIYPQYHAKEHLNVRKWMDKLQSGDTRFTKAFEMNCFSVDDESIVNQRTNLMATYDYLSHDELQEIGKSIAEGLTLFRDIFGFNSQTTIAPCYVWNQEIERIFQDQGIGGFQGSFVQQENHFGTLKKTWRAMGKLNKHGQAYLIRNGLFEPALNRELNWVEKTLESMEIAFKWGKPAVIGTHRINFVGGLSLDNRNNTLKQLDELLNKALKKWPEIVFLNSAELLGKYSNV